ncbi:tetratricopeptide repeat protein [bacterium]|nr:tetratricopeptide repeat protein [bacterium]
MKNVVLCLLALLYGYGHSYAAEGASTTIGQIDSLIKSKPHKAGKLIHNSLANLNRDTDKSKLIDLLIRKSELYYYQAKYDTALTIAWKVLYVSKKNNSDKIQEAYRILGNTYTHLYLSDSALYYFEKAYQMAVNQSAAKKLYYLQRLSIQHSENGSLSKALDYCITGIRIAEKTGKEHFVAIFNNRIGVIYQKQGNYNKAIQFYKNALNAYNELGDESGIALATSSVGSALMALKQYAEAKVYFDKAKEIYTIQNDPKGIAQMYDNLGMLAYRQNNLREAINLQQQALNLRAKNKNYGDLPQSYVALANSYLKLKRYDDALDLTREGIGITKKTGADVQLLTLFRQFYLIYKDLNYKDSALWYHEKYQVLKDSLDKLENDELIIRLQNIFDTERRELELIEIKKENELQNERLKYYRDLEAKDRIVKLLLTSIIVVLMVVAGLFASRYRIKSKANREISRKVKENELLLKELHHRVKNNLQFISSLFAIKSQKITDSEARQILDENLQKVRAMSLVHNLLNMNPQQDPNINLKSFIQGLANSLVLSLGLESSQLQLIYRWRRASFNMDSFNSIGLVLNEMITNSVKHCDNDDLTIKVSFYENERYKLIRYADNGPGLDRNFFAEDKQMGISLMKLLVEDIGGELKYHEPKDGESGIRISINIKKNSKNG